jgi:DNA topoisomerase-3
MNFVKDMREYAVKLVKTVAASSEVYKHDNATRVKCPECSKYLLEVNGKKGKMLVCPDRDCGYRKGVSQVSNARCPTCHKKMEIRGDGDNKIFVCGCGYREKLSAFTKRRDKEKSSLDKKDVNKFLNQQNKKDEPVNSGNSAMAEAFAKLNLK